MASNKNYMLNDEFPKRIKNATSTNDGLMSAEDKSRLDQLFEFGLLTPATPDKDGIMTKEDKTKLDGVEEGANNYIHPNTPEVRHVSDTQINKWDTQVFYNNSKPTPIALGGVKKNETFNNISYDALFTKLLYPYIDPTISNIAITPNATIIEKGNSFNLSRIYFKINSPSLADESLNYSFKVNGEKIKSMDSTNRTIDSVVTKTITDTASVTVSIKDSVNNWEGSFNLINYTFVYPFYYGNIEDSASITDSLVRSKTKLVQAKGTKTLKFNTNNEKMLFAYPKSYGQLKSVYDANNFNILSTFDITEINIIANDSSSVAYYVYTNEASSVSDYSMKFVF